MKRMQVVLMICAMALAMMGCVPRDEFSDLQDRVDEQATAIAVLSIPPATPTPWPTVTPQPTATPVPTATPQPAPTPQPTATPAPTATPQPPPAYEYVPVSTWVENSYGDTYELSTLGSSDRLGAVTLNLSCFEVQGDEVRYVALERSGGGVFFSGRVSSGRRNITEYVDGRSYVRQWYLVEDGDWFTLSSSFEDADGFINKLRQTDEISFEIRTTGEPYVLRFIPKGLDLLIDDAQHLCLKRG